MIYGKVLQKMEEKIGNFHFLFVAGKGNDEIYVVKDYVFPWIVLFKYHVAKNLFEFEGKEYDEDQFCRILDLLIFS